MLTIKQFALIILARNAQRMICIFVDLVDATDVWYWYLIAFNYAHAPSWTFQPLSSNAMKKKQTNTKQQQQKNCTDRCSTRSLFLSVSLDHALSFAQMATSDCLPGCLPDFARQYASCTSAQQNSLRFFSCGFQHTPFFILNLALFVFVHPPK